MAGLVAAPWLFGWVLLRRGYQSSLRRAVLAYVLAMPLLTLLTHLGVAVFGRG
jgi:hypothetical protein